MQDELLTPYQVAEYLKVSPNTVWHMLRDGRLKGFKPTKWQWRVYKSDLEAYLKEKHNGHT